MIFSIKHNIKRKSVIKVTEEKMNHILNQTISEFILFMEKIKQDPVYEKFFTNEKQKRKSMQLLFRHFSIAYETKTLINDNPNIFDQSTRDSYKNNDWYFKFEVMKNITKRW